MVVEWTTIKLLMPEIVLVVMATWIYVGSTLQAKQSRELWVLVAACSYLLAAFALLLQQANDGWQLGQALFGEARSFASGPLTLDALAVTFRWIALLVGLLLTLLVSRSAGRVVVPETIGTLMLMTVGLMLVAAANELVLLLLGLELISIPTYVLLFLGRPDRATAEAAGKYFFLSILSSAILLYGFTFLYGIAGTTHLSLAWRAFSGLATGGAAATLAPAALVLIMAGLGFKLAAVPFHFYAPDVYQGATNANAGLLAAVPKIAGVIALVRLVPLMAPVVGPFAWQLTIALALFTMTMGNVCALWQNNMRRLMAYSSVAHAGYMLMGLAAALAMGSAHGIAAMLFYLVVYVLATLAVFAGLGYLSGPQREVSEVAELQGLCRTEPLVAAVIAVGLFSLAGIPPLAGFWGKFGLFNSAIVVTLKADGGQSRWFLVLAIVGALNAAVAAAYYLRVVAVMFFRPAETKLPAEGGAGALATTCACAMLVLLLGVVPGPAVRLAEVAEQGARNRLPLAAAARDNQLAFQPPVAAGSQSGKSAAGQPARQQLNLAILPVATNGTKGEN